MLDRKGILVIGEVEEDRLASITKEIFGGAKELSKILGEDVSLLMVGDRLTGAAREGITSGADKVYIAENPAYSDCPYDFFTHVLSQFCLERKPFLCMVGHTDLGREVAPRVAARLSGALCVDCVGIRVDSNGKNLIQTRPVYGGKAMVEETPLPGHIAIVTVRRKVMSPFAGQSENKGEIIFLNKEFGSGVFATRLIDRKRQEAEGIDLENAKVVIAGGGGIGGKEGFETLETLAKLLEGAVGATRVPVDEGWVSHRIEIGQTGKIVSPTLYVAVGISGATQHITGILGSNCIVAINKDPDANIFKISDLGAVADYRTILPLLIAHLKTSTR